MKNLFISLLFIVVALFVVDRVGGQIMWVVNQHTKDISGPKLKYLADDVNEDVVLLGTSRCNFHYVPSILADSIGMSVYNGGIDASKCIYAHYFVLNQILRHHTPEVICLELMTSDYAQADDSFDTMSFFAPYIGRSERADSVFRDAGTYWAYRISHLYRYNAKAVSNLGGLIVNRQSESENGYIPLSQFNFAPTQILSDDEPRGVDSLKLAYVQKFIDLCKERDIKLVFMVSPSYTLVGNDAYDVLKSIAKTNDIPFLDYHTRGVFWDHPEYFRDARHLWHKGAQIYTSMFAKDLKMILNGSMVDTEN